MRKLKKFLIVIVLLIVFLLLGVMCQVTQPVLSKDSRVVAGEVDTAQLQTSVRVFAEELVPRDYQHMDNLNAAANYIHSRFARTSGLCSEQTYTVNGTEYRNVILQLGPLTDERIVVGAHYDAYGELPGADDNASGVAGLLELARLLDGADLPLTVELVAYTLEEPPFFRTENMGSAVHARHLDEQGIEVRAMIALEMIGYFSDEPDSQRFPLSILKLFYPTEGNWIGVVGDMGSGGDVRRVKAAMRGATALPVYSINAPPRWVPGVDWSDHLNYRNQGYPGVMITDTAYLRNRNYHTEEDTADKLDYERMAMVVQAVYGAVLDIAP
ncbi:MAG: M28 family peptidase [Candidatus Krumholzibacteriota bacterium]